MTTLADLHRAVRTALSGKRLGTPVFVRYLDHAPLKGQAVLARLTRTTAAVRDWLGQPLERVYALGRAAGGHVALTLEFRGGATALVSWTAAPGRGAGVDITLLGNRGALYHDAGHGELWDEPAQSADGEPDKELLALIERSLRSGRPEEA